MPYPGAGGGAGDERTLRDDVAAFARRRLRPRVLVDVSEVTTSTTVAGAEVPCRSWSPPPRCSAWPTPTASPGWPARPPRWGRSSPSRATSRPAEVAAHAPPAPRWFQLYAFKDAGITRALCEEAVEHGFDAVVLTVDAPRAGRRERDLRTGFAVPPEVGIPAVRAALGAEACPTPAEFFSLVDTSLTWQALERFAADLPLPVVAKGIQTAEDAGLACDHGATAVVVSNHGGRQLDGVAASLDLLPEVVDAVSGRLEVLMDGGVRRGTDVAVALALGARAVLVGRPALWGLAAGGEAGARHVLELLREELCLALLLLGCPSPAHVTRGHVV